MNTVTLNNSKSLTVEFDRLRPILPIDREFIAKHVCVKLHGEGKVPNGSPFSDYPEKEFWVLDGDNNWFLHFDDCGDDDEGRSITIRHRQPDANHLRTLGALGFALTDMNLILLPSMFADNGPEIHVGSDEPPVKSGLQLIEHLTTTQVDDLLTEAFG